MPNTRDSSDSHLSFFKKATIFISIFNLIAFLYLLHFFISPLYTYTSEAASFQLIRYSWRQPPDAFADIKSARIKAAIEARRTFEPIELIKRVKEIQVESSMDASKSRQSTASRKKLAAQIAERLKALRGASSETNQQALDEWRKKKLEARLRELNREEKNQTAIPESKPLRLTRKGTKGLDKGVS